jgi:hypothetical protein
MGIILEKINWKAKFLINSMFKNENGRKNHSIKKKHRVNSGEPTKLTAHVMQVIEFNNFFYLTDCFSFNKFI